jgi:hypothetical protein
MEIMPWVSIRSAEKTTLNLLARMDDTSILTIKSFKKDRTATILKNDNIFQVNEDGFRKKIFRVDSDHIRKSIREIIEVEFPRSHQVMISVRSRDDRS